MKSSCIVNLLKVTVFSLLLSIICLFIVEIIWGDEQITFAGIFYALIIGGGVHFVPFFLFLLIYYGVLKLYIVKFSILPTTPITNVIGYSLLLTVILIFLVFEYSSKGIDFLRERGFDGFVKEYILFILFGIISLLLLNWRRSRVSIVNCLNK